MYLPVNVQNYCCIIVCMAEIHYAIFQFIIFLIKHTCDFF